jgi:chitodextrinase
MAIGCLLLPVLLGFVPPVTAPEAAAAEEPCSTSGPASGVYSASVCFTAPTSGGSLSGAVTVTVVVNVVGPSAGVQKVVFLLDGTDLITDYSAPYTFSLPTNKFQDGSGALTASATFRDGFTSTAASMTISLANGNTTPPVNTNTFTPTAGTAPAPSAPFVLAAVGDGADGGSSADAVSTLIQSWNPNLFLYLGDVYDDGTSTEYANWYGGATGTFGRFRSITNPTVGNHEYTGNSAPGYFDYWDNVPNYYSVNAAGWHIISLNSTGQFNQTAAGTAQYQWLQQDLAANAGSCTLVEFHHPLYNVGKEGPAARMSEMWTLMAANGVDVVLNGHAHNYQRWTALDGSGTPAPDGITEFVVGSGGHGIQPFTTTDTRMVAGVDTPATGHGALRMELGAQGAGYQFVNTAGTVLDSGSVQCSGTPVDTVAPGIARDVTAVATTPHQVRVSWSAPIDNVGVTGYDILRNGVPLATTGPETAFIDNTAAAELIYRYQVVARDAAGNVSSPSAMATATTPPGEGGLFVDDFESGNLASWRSVSGLVVQQQAVFSGRYSARATTSGPAAWADANLSTAQTNLYYRVRFQIISQGSNAYLLKVRTGTGQSLLGVYVTSTGRLAYRNDVTGVSTVSPVSVSAGTWHTLQLHAGINGSAGATETWFDDVLVTSLSTAQNLGTAPIGRIQLGDNSAGRSYDIAFDTVRVDDQMIVTDTTAPNTPPNFSAVAQGFEAVDLAWNASSDNLGVTGYTVYRDGQAIAVVDGSTLTFSDTAVVPDRTYGYTVDAFDGAGNRSPQSAPVAVTTGPDTAPPSRPGALVVSGLSATEVDLSWEASTDNVGVAGYRVNRDGVALATVAATTTSFSDTTVAGGVTYSYTVEAFDAAGNRSPASDPAIVTTPSPYLFSDSFETGNFSRWTTNAGLVAQQQDVYSGAWAARATGGDSGPSAAYLQLAGPQSSVYFQVRFQVVAQSGNVYLGKLRTAAGASLLGVYLSSGGAVSVRNDVTGQSTTSSTIVTAGSWHTLQVHALTGAQGRIEVWIDGVAVTALTGPASLGSTPVGRVQLGENTKSKNFNMALDDVVVSTSFINAT